MDPAGTDTENPPGTCHLCLQDFDIKETILLRCIDGCSVRVCLKCGPTSVKFGKCMFCHAAIDCVLNPISREPLEDPKQPSTVACMYTGLISLVFHICTIYALDRNF